jgi:catechol 2,3-dioxygenase-like lactoylglutathione lyase family enzyme
MEEATMTTPVGGESTSGLGVDMRPEVVTLPVAGIDQAKEFYSRLGWRLDAGLTAGDDFRVVRFTPPHSQCSIHFGQGLTAAEPGSVDREDRYGV